MLLELLAEVLEHRGDRHRHRVAQHAQAVADDVALDLAEDVEVHRRALALVDALEHLHGPVRALAAGHALAARLVAVELGQPQRERHQRLGVVDHDHRGRAQHRPGLGHRLVGEGQVEVLLGQHRRRRAAGEEALELAPLGRAAGKAVDDLAHGDAELDLEVAGPLHVARDRHELGAGRVALAELAVPVGAVLDDDRRVAERLDVVDQRRALVEALVGGERRLEARVAALALERVEQAGLLAADVGALAAVDDQRRTSGRSRGCARPGSPCRRPRRRPRRGCPPAARTRRG